MSGGLVDASCPRCGGGFECGFQAGHCACFGIRLTERLRVQLAERYRGCLCLPCLRALIEADARRVAGEPLAEPRAEPPAEPPTQADPHG